MADRATIHASAILVGPKAALIRGPAGSGKSLLTWRLLEAAAQGLLRFACLVADDRVRIDCRADRLVARPAEELSGLIECRGLGIRRVPFEAAAVVGLVIDLAAPDSARHPEPAAQRTVIEGVALPRLAVAAGTDPLPLVLAALRSLPQGN